MSLRRVVVTGLGVISPVGNTTEDFWRSLVEGKSGIGKITYFDVSDYTSQIAGELKNFVPSPKIPPKELKRMAKFVQYAATASVMATEDSGLNIAREDPYRIGVLIGSGIGSLQVTEEQHSRLLEKGPSKLSPFLIPMLIVNMASGQVAILLQAKGPNSAVATACATGNHAIGDAFKIIQRGDAEMMIAGGTESAITPMAVGGFCALKALSRRNDAPQQASRPFDQDRDGFVMAEGAGIVILEEAEHAKKRGAKIYAELVGYGLTADAYHITAPDPVAEGPAMAMKNALNDAGVAPEELSYINAHGTSTPLNDKVETLAIKKALGNHATGVAISSTKSMTGHLLGAAGGVEFVAIVLAVKNNLMPPTINYETPDPECDLDYIPNTARQSEVEVAMSNSLGFGGHNATLVIKKFK